MNDEPEFIKEEIEERARELARRVTSIPHQKQEWPRKPRARPGEKNAAT